MKTIKEKTLEFFILLTILFIILFFLFKTPVMLYIGIGIGVIALLPGKLSHWGYIGWIKFSQGLAFIITHLILSIVFYLILFPISIIYRMVNKDALKLKTNTYSTLYETRSKLFTAADLENMW